MRSRRFFPLTLTVFLLFFLSGITAGQEAQPTEEPTTVETAQEEQPAVENAGGEDAPEVPPTKLLQIALFKPYQLHKPEVSIAGLRWNILYGVNENVSGLDLGIVNIATGNFKGLQFGGYNSAQKASGAQVGLLNTSQEGRGLQVGIFNHSEAMNGLQIGLLYNTTETLKGVQIGLLNFVWTREPMFFFPIVNASF